MFPRIAVLSEPGVRASPSGRGERWIRVQRLAQLKGKFGRTKRTRRLASRCTAAHGSLRICKLTLRRVVAPIVIYGPIVYFFPELALLYAVCGAYDVSRNTGLNMSMVRRYFLGNGASLWLLSPLNVLLDILSLPYVNKGIYRLEDMPAGTRRKSSASSEPRPTPTWSARSTSGRRRTSARSCCGATTGSNPRPSSTSPPSTGLEYLQTIALSVFNKKVSTSLHFGWVRASLRVLYNINDITGESAYIIVGTPLTIGATTSSSSSTTRYSTCRPTKPMTALLHVRRYPAAVAVPWLHGCGVRGRRLGGDQDQADQPDQLDARSAVAVRAPVRVTLSQDFGPFC